jgi:Lrp/AsnC family leucine-responsive transcriptional regulator
MIDDIDGQILTIIQDNARTPNAEIARQVGMAPSAIFERIRKLEERGVIEEYEARLNPHALGLGLVAFVFVRAEEKVGSRQTGALLAEIPQVQEVHHIAGEDCYLVKVRARDTEALWEILRDRFGALEAVKSTRTTIVLETVKETARLPLEIATERQAETEAAHG